MQSWYHSMAPNQRRTFWACFLGWALDAMDVQLFAFVIPTLLGVWGMTKGEAGIIGTSALTSSAIGGVIAGVLADRIGRVKVLKLVILWFSRFTGLSAFTDSFHQLLLTRSLQGLGFGGESAAGATLTVLAYTQFHLPMGVLLLLGFPLGLFQSGIVSGMGACFTELFPTQVRGTAGGFSYNFGRGVGALVPAGVGMTSGSIGLAVSIGIWAACSYLLVFAVALVLPETRNKELEVYV